jgi:hypothetical protein
MGSKESRPELIFFCVLKYVLGDVHQQNRQEASEDLAAVGLGLFVYGYFRFRGLLRPDDLLWPGQDKSDIRHRESSSHCRCQHHTCSSPSLAGTAVCDHFYRIEPIIPVLDMGGDGSARRAPLSDSSRPFNVHWVPWGSQDYIFGHV